MHDADIERVVRFLASCPPDAWLELPLVGQLTVKRYAPYVGRNPRTGEAVPVPEVRRPFFRADPSLRRALNPSFEAVEDDAPESDEAPATRAEALGRAVREALLGPGIIALPGLGTFEVVAKEGRPGRNPQTGEVIVVPARNVVVFTAALELVARLDASG